MPYVLHPDDLKILPEDELTAVEQFTHHFENGPAAYKDQSRWREAKDFCSGQGEARYDWWRRLRPGVFQAHKKKQLRSWEPPDLADLTISFEDEYDAAGNPLPE